MIIWKSIWQYWVDGFATKTSILVSLLNILKKKKRWFKMDDKISWQTNSF